MNGTFRSMARLALLTAGVALLAACGDLAVQFAPEKLPSTSGTELAT